ncbi:MAG: hypothetical protein LBD22_07520 [Spirochaetaceae bacterium]|jgi:hypothetical protein|nr:hypothetical protein [Spirochaetaceae bacterium]
MKKAVNSKFLVKISCIVGIFVISLFAFFFVFTALRTKGSVFSMKNQMDGASFIEKLRKFDENLYQYTQMRREANLDIMQSLLNALEKSAVGAEGELSVLKRWRKLVKLESTLVLEYEAAAERAVDRFPHSTVIAALAGEARVEARGTGSEETREKLRSYARVLSNAGPLAESSSMPLAFCFYALSDSLQNAKAARGTGKIDELFLIALRNFDGIEAEAMLINAALLKIVDSKKDEAAAFLVPLNMEAPKSNRARSFFANYAYDFGDPLRAAELWTQQEKAELGDIARAADAFYLAGRTANALQLWQLLARNTKNNTSDKKINLQSLYNIAALAEKASDRIAALEELLAHAEGDLSSSSALYGMALYTRLINEDRAIALLEEIVRTTKLPLFDLELFRHKLNKSHIDRAIADTWLLIDRNPLDSFIYRWAAWYFDFQRRFTETDFLISTAEKRGISGSWILLNQALNFMRDEDYTAALEELEQIARMPQDENDVSLEEDMWPGSANKALILEARHDFRGAYEHYKRARDTITLTENAYSIHKNSKRQSAARLELKMARCLTILGRKEEARQAVLNAAALDGDNINVRVALNRL